MRFPVTLLLLALVVAPARAERQMESLDRGLVAVRRDDESVLVSWRIFGTDPGTIAFHLYRSERGQPARLLTEDPLSGPSCFLDEAPGTGDALRYFVAPVVDSREGERSEPAPVWDHGYLDIPIDSLPGYRPGDASAADLDGDGDYEIVLHQVSRGRDNSHSGLTGTPILDAYTLEGRRLWRIDLGRNIREGEHYTQFLVYDLDGDGRAEVVCKTADGTVDGTGTMIGDANKDWRVRDEDSRRYGRVLAGPEYLTVFDGLTGAAMATVAYVPGRDPIDGWGGIGGNGGNDDYGNRCDRFLACVAYLDGERPSAVMCRGVYGRTVLAAWDWRDGKLAQRWVFDSGISHPPYRDASPYSGMGGHSIGVADVDADGRDEIVYQAMVVDDDGSGLHSSGLRHGDVMVVSDLDPDRPGLEVFTIQENEGHTVRFRTPGAALRDAGSGEILWSHSPGVDVPRGLAADIDPRHPGCEAWGGPGGLRNVKGEPIGQAPRTSGFAIWWDGDLLRELLDSGRITKWNWEREEEETLLRLEGRRRGRPSLVADLLGDWREELLVAAPDGNSLRLYASAIPTPHRQYTLMHDPQYRLDIALQNVAYNRPAQPGFFLGHGMRPAPTPAIRLIGARELAPNDDEEERPQRQRQRESDREKVHDPSRALEGDDEGSPRVAEP